MYLAIDTGGTNLRVEGFSSLDPGGGLGGVTFPVSDDFRCDYKRLVKSCLDVAGAEPIEAIGLAVAGKLNRDRSQLLGAGNLTHWVGMPVGTMLKRDLCLDCPVILGNDAEAGALAEALYGHGTALDFWFLVWGTGVGGCLINWPDHRPRAVPSEVGHQVIDCRKSIPPCGCGRDGCLESLAGGRSFVRFGHSVTEMTGKEWEEVAEWMAMGVYNLMAIRPTPWVVFSGGVATKQPHLLTDIELRLHRDRGIITPPIMRLSAFGESAGIIGALALLKAELPDE